MGGNLCRVFSCLGSINYGVSLTASASSRATLGVVGGVGLCSGFSTFIYNSSIGGNGPSPRIFLVTTGGLNLRPISYITFRSDVGNVGSTRTTNVAAIVIPSLLRPASRVGPVVSFLYASLDRTVGCLWVRGCNRPPCPVHTGLGARFVLCRGVYM